MPQSLSLILAHVVFSTEHRNPYLAADCQPNLHSYLAQVTRNAGCECYRVGGVSDHVHLALRLSRTITIAKLVETLKLSSSKWLKTETGTTTEFAWQNGYGAFSLSPSALQPLISYIDSQPEHHRTVTFQEEYLQLLKELGVSFDERYLWD